MSEFWDDIVADMGRIAVDPNFGPAVEKIAVTFNGRAKSVEIDTRVLRDVPVETTQGVDLALQVIVTRADWPVVSIGNDVVYVELRKGAGRKETRVSRIAEQNHPALWTLQLQ